MDILHDNIATQIGDLIVEKIRTEDTEWKQGFSSSVHRIGDWNLPRPDYIFEDSEMNISCALGFITASDNEATYVKVIGKVLSFLQHHNYCGLIVPRTSKDGFKVSEYIYNYLMGNELKNFPILLVEYINENIKVEPQNSIFLLKRILSENSINNKKVNFEMKPYWCWWRDTSHYEIYNLLELSDKYNSENGDIYTKYIYPEFYEMLITGETKQWNGLPRNKKVSKASYKSEKQNYKIPLFQLGLWDQAEGRLTNDGRKLLINGKINGSDSKEFKEYLAYLLLVDGKHLDLINDVIEFQRQYIDDLPSSRDKYFTLLDNFMTSKGAIGKRKPTAKTTGAKQSYLRDEPKLWNKFDFIELKNSKQYFRPFEGIKFNWEKISKILLGNYD